MLSPDLFGSSSPPLVVVTLDALGSGPTEDVRQVHLRIKPAGDPSLYASGLVDRYAPEHTLLLGCAHLMEDLEVLQRRPRPVDFTQMLHDYLKTWADPF